MRIERNPCRYFIFRVRVGASLLTYEVIQEDVPVMNILVCPDGWTALLPL